MSQTLVIRTPDAVSTTSRIFPKQGVFNLKITKNYKYDTVELWVRSGASNITLELEGASFQSTAQVSRAKIIPPSPTVINSSTLALTPNSTHYVKIKLNNNVSVAYLRCSYSAKSGDSTVVGGNIEGQAFVDYSKKPYISTNLLRMFEVYPVRFDITKWDVSSVTDFRDVFRYNPSFNQDLSSWDVSNGTNMLGMFVGASSFNYPVGNWDVSKVTSMHAMFNGAKNFNQPIGEWDVSKVTIMDSMFQAATSFNQPIGNWDVSSVATMYLMFSGATNFNQPIGNWDVSNLTNMQDMFQAATSFNQPIGNWDVSKVTNMRGTFAGATSFNYPIGDWDVSKVTTMYAMFAYGIPFNQDLSSWPAKFQVNVNLGRFFDLSTWGTTNYDKFLNALWTDINSTRPQAWATRTQAKLLEMGSSKYSAASAAARASLVSKGWTITDGGLTA